MSDLLTAGDAALILGVSPATVRLWALAGKLAAQQTQRGVRIFDRREVERMKREREAERAAAGDSR